MMIIDYWKPEELPIGGDVSDSSENSNSMITNLSMERVERDADTSDSSDDDYMPLCKYIILSTTECKEMLLHIRL